jgi:hypothetical protein
MLPPVFMLIRNVGKYLPVHMASSPGRLETFETSPKPLRERHNLVRTQMLRVILEFNNICKNTNTCIKQARKNRVSFVATCCEIRFSKLSDHIRHFINVTENSYMKKCLTKLINSTTCPNTVRKFRIAICKVY